MNSRRRTGYRVLAGLLAYLLGSAVGHAELPGPPIHGAMTAKDIASLPRSVAPEFRSVHKYEWKSVDFFPAAYGFVMKATSNCVSLGLNQPGRMGLAGGTEADDSGTFAVDTPCKTAEAGLLNNDGLEVAPSNGDSCDFAQGWYPIMIVFSDRSEYIRKMHMVRQLEDGRLVEILGISRPITFAMRGDRILTSFAEYASMARRIFPVACPVWCVRRKSAPPSPEQVFDFGSSRAQRTWTAVTLESEQGRHTVRPGMLCGPFRQRINLLVNLPDGWFGTLIPGARTGFGATTLEVVSNLEGSSDALSFAGVNLTLAGAVAGPGTLSFDRFYDAQGQDGMGPIDPRTGQRMVPNFDPRGGVRLVALAPLGDGWLSARLEGATVCPRELVLAPTVQMRGQPPSAWPKPLAKRPGQ